MTSARPTDTEHSTLYEVGKAARIALSLADAGEEHFANDTAQATYDAIVALRRSAKPQTKHDCANADGHPHGRCLPQPCRENSCPVVIRGLLITEDTLRLDGTPVWPPRPGDSVELSNMNWGWTCTCVHATRPESGKRS